MGKKRRKQRNLQTKKQQSYSLPEEQQNGNDKEALGITSENDKNQEQFSPNTMGKYCQFLAISVPMSMIWWFCWTLIDLFMLCPL